MPHQSDGALLSEVEEWITGKEALLYIRIAFDLALDMNTLFMLGGKFGLIKKVGDTLLFDSRGVHYTISRCYFPSIPKGWMTPEALEKKYPYAEVGTIKQWIHQKKLGIKKIEIGTEEVRFVEEAAFKKLYKEAVSQKRLHKQPGNEWRRVRRTDGKGKGPRKRKDTEYKRYIKKKYRDKE